MQFGLDISKAHSGNQIVQLTYTDMLVSVLGAFNVTGLCSEIMCLK